MNENHADSINALSHNWWMFALRGVAAIIFGILAFGWPGLTLLTLLFLFGIYALVNGVLALLHAFTAPKGYPRFGSLVFNGLISIAAGVLTFVWPGITALTLVLVIAAWAIINGFSEIATAIRLRRVISGEWLLVAAGLLSILLGLVMLIQPAVGALALVWWIATFAVLFGVLLIALSVRVRRWGRIAPEAPAAPSL